MPLQESESGRERERKRERVFYVCVVHGEIPEGKHLAALGNAPLSAANATPGNATLAPQYTCRLFNLHRFTHHSWLAWLASQKLLSSMHHQLDPHERPPDGIRAVYKKYQKMKRHELDQDDDMIDVPLDKDSPAAVDRKLRLVQEYAAIDLTATFRAFGGQAAPTTVSSRVVAVYEHTDMPGT